MKRDYESSDSDSEIVEHTKSQSKMTKFLQTKNVEESCIHPSTSVDDMSSPSSSSEQTSTDVPVKRATIWSYFQKCENNIESKCNICHMTLKTPVSTTTTLIRHLKNKHKNKYIEFDEQNKKNTNLKKKAKETLKKEATTSRTLKEFVKNPLNPESNRAKTISEKIGKMIALDLQPYSFVEDKGFLSLINFFEPNYICPSRSQFTRKIIPEMYNAKKQEIMDIINNEKRSMECVSFTADLWTSRSTSSFISLSVHYILNNFQEKHYSLDCCPFPEKKTGENISRKLRGLIEEWNLGDLTVPLYVVTDNGANIVSGIRQYANVNHISCMAHTIQLAIDDAKKNTGIDILLTKARKIVSHYSHSTKGTHELLRLQKQMKLPQNKLIQMVETRWNSEFYMLQRLVEQQQAIAAELANQSKTDNLLSSEWTMAKSIIKILEPIEIATRQLSSNRLPTLSLVLPILYSIQTQLKHFIESKEPGIMFAKNLNRSLETRFSMLKDKENPEHILAMLLDPRFKNLALLEHEKVFGRKLLIEALKLRWKIEEGMEDKINRDSSDDLPRSKLWGPWDRLASQAEVATVTTSVEQQKIEKEVSFYLEQHVEKREIDVLKWWEQHKTIYEKLAPLAQRYLSIPATEVYSERMFSKAGNIVTQRRERLKEEHVQQLVFLNENSLK